MNLIDSSPRLEKWNEHVSNHFTCIQKHDTDKTGLKCASFISLHFGSLFCLLTCASDPERTSSTQGTYAEPMVRNAANTEDNGAPSPRKSL